MRLQKKLFLELSQEIPVLEENKEGLLKGGFIAPTIGGSGLDLLGEVVNNCGEYCTTNINCPCPIPTETLPPTDTETPTPTSPDVDILGTSLLF